LNDIYVSYEAAAEAALASIAAGDVSVGGITGSADGVWTLREGSTLRSSTLGEVSYLTRFGYNTSPSSSANDKTSENVAFASTGTPSAATAAAAATRTAIPMEKREEKEANVETSLEKRRVLIQNASAWAGMAAWPMTIRLGPLPSGSRAEPFLMVRHPLKVARSALATDWNFVYKFLVDQVPFHLIRYPFKGRSVSPVVIFASHLLKVIMSFTSLYLLFSATPKEFMARPSFVLQPFSPLFFFFFFSLSLFSVWLRTALRTVILTWRTGFL